MVCLHFEKDCENLLLLWMIKYSMGCAIFRPGRLKKKHFHADSVIELFKLSLNENGYFDYIIIFLVKMQKVRVEKSPELFSPWSKVPPTFNNHSSMHFTCICIIYTYIHIIFAFDQELLHSNSCFCLFCITLFPPCFSSWSTQHMCSVPFNTPIGFQKWNMLCTFLFSFNNT